MEMNGGGSSELNYYPSVSQPSLQIAERVWTTSMPPTHALVIIHGGMWHSGWFGKLGDAVCSQPDVPIRVSAPDLPSHGLSGDYVDGMRMYVPNVAHFTEEAVAAVARARASVGDAAKIYILGESLGGLVSMMALVDKGLEVDGLILCGALLGFAPRLRPPSFIIPFVRVAAHFWPTAAFPSDIGGDTFEEAFADPAMAQLAREDPLVSDKAPMRIGNAIQVLDAMERVRKLAHEAVRVKSVLFMHYTDDVRTSYGDARSVVESLAHTEDKLFYPVDGTAHQMFQDIEEKRINHINAVHEFIRDRA